MHVVLYYYNIMSAGFRISPALWDKIHHFASFPQTGGLLLFFLFFFVFLFALATLSNLVI